MMWTATRRPDPAPMIDPTWSTRGPRLLLAAVALVLIAAPAHAQTRRTVEAQELRERSLPRGWIGLNIEALTGVTERVEGSDHYVRFFEYPRVISVDPNSPAERAGIRSGDTLVGYGDVDVRQEVAMNRLLVPDSRLEVRVRRNGSVLTLPVRVARAPRAIMRRRMDLSLPAIAAAPMPPTPDVPPGAMVMRVPSPAMAPAATWVTVAPQPDADALLGARLATVTRAFSDATGLPRGVVVLEVIPGSPAQESGLRAGDVVVRADGPVSDISDIHRALVGRSDRTLPLQVRRKGATRKLVLKW